MTARRAKCVVSDGEIDGCLFGVLKPRGSLMISASLNVTGNSKTGLHVERILSIALNFQHLCEQETKFLARCT